MNSYREYRNEALKDPNAKQAYGELGSKYDVIQAMIDARKTKKITQMDLVIGIDTQLNPWFIKVNHD